MDAFDIDRRRTADAMARRAAARSIRDRAAAQAKDWNAFAADALADLADDEAAARSYRLRKAAQREAIWAQGEIDAWA